MEKSSKYDSMEKLNIKFVKSHPSAHIPTKKPGDAGYDLYSVENVLLKPFEQRDVNTGISIEIPDGYYGSIRERSGLAFKSCISVGGGVIDSTYRGNIKVLLRNNNVIFWLIETFNSVMTKIANPLTSITQMTGSHRIQAGDRIAQIIFEKYHDVDFVETDKLEETVRADNGFGSSGA